MLESKFRQQVEVKIVFLSAEPITLSESRTTKSTGSANNKFLTTGRCENHVCLNSLDIVVLRKYTKTVVTPASTNQPKPKTTDHTKNKLGHQVDAENVFVSTVPISPC